jgi:superoxide reductase
MATKLNEIYKCEVCGNITEMVHEGEGDLVCCGQPMTLQKENTQDAVLEKHVPYVEREEDIVYIQIGETIHPSTDEHYIEWIELLTDDNEVLRQYLNPQEEPKAQFLIPEAQELGQVRAYCNMHGLWKKDM